MGTSGAVIHYHGTPITPRAQLLRLAGRHFCVSFARPDNLDVCLEIGSSLMLDNGAFSFWRAGAGDVDVGAYAAWVAPLLERRENWCVIPDKIDGSSAANEHLMARWSHYGLPPLQCAPVWHMDESVERLRFLGEYWPRVCLGSSGAYAKVGDARWHARMREAMSALCGDGPAPCWLHMLRGMKLAGSEYPFASADSATIGLNHLGNNTRGGAPKDVERMADEIDGRQCPGRWHRHSDQLGLEPTTDQGR